MNTKLNFLWVAVLAICLWNCAGQKGTVIEGQITNAQNTQVFLDEVSIGKASNVLAKSDIDGQGNFRFEFPEGIQAGVYNLRIGARKVNLVFDGKENKVVLNGDLNTLDRYEFSINGSDDSYTLAKTMQSLIQRKYKPEDVSAFIDTVENTTLGVFVAYKSLGGSGQYFDLQRKAVERHQKDNPNSELATAYTTYIDQMEQQATQRRASELIQVGQPAPDIRLKSPDGKEYSLSDLKGEVVLLDFWASWCGPCRKENPNVVKVYDRYKDQGFTVFSVSLDGIDQRTRSRLGGRDENQVMDEQRQRWVKAIEQDNLKWEYHVSDLKKWESRPAALYGVRGIPKTFLIDRDGKIAATGLRGAVQIEQALKQVL